MLDFRYLLFVNDDINVSLLFNSLGNLLGCLQIGCIIDEPLIFFLSLTLLLGCELALLLLISTGASVQGERGGEGGEARGKGLTYQDRPRFNIMEEITVHVYTCGNLHVM